MPTARFYNESVYGFTLYDGNPDQKITMTSSPYDWMEASFFYTNVQGKRYCSDEFDPVCNQDYKDKGFNFKFRLKEEGIFPAIAIGINDIAGTGLYSSEYVVASYGINNLDIHFGLGWGALNGSSNSFKNPLINIYENFGERPEPNESGDNTGQFEAGRYFSGQTVSPFFGISYVLNRNLRLKIENDTTLTPGIVGYDAPNEEYSFGFEYDLNDNFSIGFTSERGNDISFRFVYKNNPKSTRKTYEYKKVKHENDVSKQKKLIRNLERNGIGVNRILESSEEIGLELTQFIHPNLEMIDKIIKRASIEAGIEKEIKTELRIANLKASSEFTPEFEEVATVTYQRKKQKNFNSNTYLNFRPFLASREEFFKGALLVENSSEYVISDNLIFSSNLKYSLADNFDDLTIPPVNTYPAQVRSDVKEYLRNFDDGVILGRAQLDFFVTPKNNHHFMFSAGILEEMFNGYGFEYLYFQQDKNYAIGFDIFNVKKRDYKLQFGTLDYENITGSVNFYFRNFKLIPFDAKISYGEYLAGDLGATIDLSRTFANGTKYGVFATFTDVSREQFGEGSFDKGIYFNIPIFGNLVSYSWRPLTKDPGQKLIRKNTLHDLLVRFRDLN